MKKFKLLLRHKLFLVVLIIGTYLIFKNLDNIYLWQDEAETAMLAKNILHYYLPLSWDGVNYVTQQSGTDANNNFVWIFHPWLQFYIAALGGRIFGLTTLGMRLPFALIGVGSIILMYIISLKVFKSIKKASLTTLLLSTNVSFLLFIRQSRYYSPAVFLVLAILYIYLLDKKKINYILLGFCLTLLFHTNYLIFVPVVVSLVIHVLVSKLSLKKIVDFGLSLLICFLLTVPWLYFARIERLAPSSIIKPNLLGLTIVSAMYVNNNFFPILFAPLLVLFMFKNRATTKINFWLLLIIMLIVTLVTIANLSADIRSRYFVGLIPIGILIIMSVIFFMWDNKRIVYRSLAILIFLVVISSNLFSKVLYWPLDFLIRFPPVYLGQNEGLWISNLINYGLINQHPFGDYWYEIHHDYDGPIEGIVKYLQNHAKPGQTLATNYGELPIMFYTKLKIVSRLPNAENLSQKLNKLPTYLKYDGLNNVDWLIIRKSWPTNFYDEGDYSKYLSENKIQYKEIIIPYPDIQWENRPTPDKHLYKTSTITDKITIYKRIN